MYIIGYKYWDSRYIYRKTLVSYVIMSHVRYEWLDRFMTIIK